MNQNWSDQNQNQNQYEYDRFNQEQATYGQQSYGEMPMYPVAPPKTNGKAIAALVLGILSLFVPYVGFVLGIIAIVLASISFKEMRINREQGRGLAIGGLVCGIIATVIYAILILIVIIAAVAISTSPDVFSNF